MRHLLFLILLLFSKSFFGQQIELSGRYVASFIGGESIEFVGKDSFYFDGFYCTFGVHGKGRCEIRNDYLYLFFQTSPTRTTIDSLKPPIITKSLSPGNVSEIQITVVDNNNVPISYATVEIESGNSPHIATSADEWGKAIFRINNAAFPIVVKTSAVGIEPGHLKIDTGSNQIIKLFHRQSASVEKELNNGEVRIYEIGAWSEDVVELRPKNSSERFRRYRKRIDKAED